MSASSTLTARRKASGRSQSTRRVATASLVKPRSRVQLELERLTIHRPKERWNLYFVVATDHPTKSNAMALTVFPSKPIALRGASDNKIRFEPKGKSTEGLTVFERGLPGDRKKIRVRAWLMHSRKNTRNAGTVIKEVCGFLNKKGAPIATALGGTNPWVAIGIAANQGIGKIGKALSKIKDREMGFVSMDETIGPEFESVTEVDRSNKLSTGWATLCWAWGVS